MATEDKKPAEAETKTAPQVAPGEQPDPMSLSIGDLKNLSTIIDVATSRGAFRANELASVGTIYNKLQAFLTKVTATDKPVMGQPAPASAPAIESTEGK
mgnify:FL=1